jgi:hypothetical protein
MSGSRTSFALYFFELVRTSCVTVLPVHRLYRQCLRSCLRCPAPQQQETMQHYVRHSFRGGASLTDSRYIRAKIEDAQSQLDRMEELHNAREQREGGAVSTGRSSSRELPIQDHHNPAPPADTELAPNQRPGLRDGGPGETRGAVRDIRSRWCTACCPGRRRFAGAGGHFETRAQETANPDLEAAPAAAGSSPLASVSSPE